MQMEKEKWDNFVLYPTIMETQNINLHISLYITSDEKGQKLRKLDVGQVISKSANVIKIAIQTLVVSQNLFLIVLFEIPAKL